MIPDLSLLTQKQKRVYAIIESFIVEKGFSPTVREIAEILGDRTPATVQGILIRLEQKGAIRRKSGAARSIQLVSEQSNYGAVLYLPVIKKITDRTIADLTGLYNVENYQPLPAALLPPQQRCFLFRCPDSSSRDSSIRYQDILLICRTSPVKEGDIVLVLHKNHSFLRKYCTTEDPEIILLKDDRNPMGREQYARNEIHLIGKLIGKYRQYG